MKLPMLSYGRLRKIEARQMPPRWLKAYEPSMKASRDEAPKISRPSTIHVAKIGRSVHCMSRAEQRACTLAAYHPNVFDIHEQHMLHPRQAPHPLADHPEAKGLALLPVPGTLRVCDEMGPEVLRRHPIVHFTEKEKLNPKLDCERIIPFPYLGDFLVFLRDDQGVPYAVNWTVKKTPEQFDGFLPNQPGKSLSKYRVEHEQDDTRHRIEEEYFRQAGVRTVRIAESELDKQVITNLAVIACNAARAEPLDYEQREKLEDCINELVGTSTTLLTKMPALCKQFNCKDNDILTALWQGIGSRRIRTDLHYPISADKPLRKERLDVLEEYSHYFAKEA